MKAVFKRIQSNMRHMLAFSLACLTAASMLAVYAVPASAGATDSANGGRTTVWEWKRVTGKNDLKAFVGKNVPVYICWEAADGTTYALSGTERESTFRSFYLDGISSRNVANMPADMLTAYKKYLQETQESAISGYNSFDDYFVANANNSNLLDAFRDNVAGNSKESWATSPAAQRFWISGSGDFSFARPLKGKKISDLSGVSIDSDVFYTAENNSKLSMDVKKYTDEGTPIVLFKGDGKSLSVMSSPIVVGSLDLDWGNGTYLTNVECAVLTADNKNEPGFFGFGTKLVDPDKVQLPFCIEGEISPYGLCYDGAGVAVVCPLIGIPPLCTSNFALYYGTSREMMDIKEDYTITKGSTYNAKSNTVIDEGTRLLIEPGATLTVSGILYNRGTIENCGTIVINNDSAICTDNGSEGCINNYGSTVEFSSTFFRDNVKKATEKYEEKLAEYEESWRTQFSLPYATIQSRRLAYNASLKYASPTDRASIEAALADLEKEEQKLKEDTAKLREDYDDFIANRDQVIRDYMAENKTTDDPTSYDDCGGELIVMNEAALYMGSESGQPLYVYQGATVLNMGVMVLPNGISIEDGEVQNRGGAGIFAGFYAKKFTPGPKILNDKSNNATIDGLEKMAAQADFFGSSGSYFNNEGTTVLNGTLKMDNAAKTVSGQKNVFYR